MRYRSFSLSNTSSPFIFLSTPKFKFRYIAGDKMAPLATVGILSIGEMGMGIAKLLIAHGYRVVTNLEGRRLVFMFYLHFFPFLSLFLLFFL
jgi:hypothetical protein